MKPKKHPSGPLAGSLTMQLAKEIEMIGKTKNEENHDEIVRSDSEGATTSVE